MAAEIKAKLVLVTEGGSLGSSTGGSESSEERVEKIKSYKSMSVLADYFLGGSFGLALAGLLALDVAGKVVTDTRNEEDVKDKIDNTPPIETFDEGAEAAKNLGEGLADTAVGLGELALSGDDTTKSLEGSSQALDGMTDALDVVTGVSKQLEQNLPEPFNVLNFGVTTFSAKLTTLGEKMLEFTNAAIEALNKLNQQKEQRSREVATNLYTGVYGTPGTLPTTVNWLADVYNVKANQGMSKRVE